MQLVTGTLKLEVSYGLVNYMGSCLIYNTKYDDDGEKAKIIRVEEKDMDIIIENGLRRDK